MTYYLLIITAALLFSLQFFFNKGYENCSGNGLGSAICFSFYTALIGAAVALVMNGFVIKFSLFSILFSVLVGASSIAYSYCAVKALGKANVSYFSMFAMLGGMLLPFLYGIIFCGEPITLTGVLCCALVAVSLYISSGKGQLGKDAMWYYVGVFVLNGLGGVFGKFHQMNAAIAADSNSYMFYQKLATVAICIVLLILGKHDIRIKRAPLAFCAGYSVLCTVGNIFLLISLLHLPASVQYPLVTGGTIVFSVIIDLLRGEKIKPRIIFAALVAFVAVTLMAL